MIGIREEFEKAFNEYLDSQGAFWTSTGVALWAAQWMAKKCAKEVSGYMGRDVEPSEKIHRLSQEMRGE